MHNFTIESHKGPYEVEFDNNILNSDKLNHLGSHYIIDKNVLPLLGENFYQNVNDKVCIVIEATEETKSYKGLEPIIEALINNKLKKDGHLVAIGGGITQDITCFVANTYMRGLDWTFVPTTLLAQADSCIGSKSSINFGKTKNILGSFTPPKKVIISEQFLSTLESKEINSGIGEIVKLYLIDGQVVQPNDIKDNLTFHLFNTLQIKKRFIETDEFDKGVRNILNYGHCFGHAIESACNFSIPHGISVAIGMDIANKISLNNNLIDESFYYFTHKILKSIYRYYESTIISSSLVFDALLKDKKNTGNTINIILPVDKQISKYSFERNEKTLKMFKETLFQMTINFVD